MNRLALSLALAFGPVLAFVYYHAAKHLMSFVGDSLSRDMHSLILAGAAGFGLLCAIFLADELAKVLVRRTF